MENEMWGMDVGPGKARGMDAWHTASGIHSNNGSSPVACVSGHSDTHVHSKTEAETWGLLEAKHLC